MSSIILLLHIFAIFYERKQMLLRYENVETAVIFILDKTGKESYTGVGHY